MLKDLNWDTYLELNNFLENETYKDVFLSPISLCLWNYYGILHKMHIEDNFVILYTKYESDVWPENDDI
ncbi:MAG: hypothetical protein ACRC4L_00380, partial [Mycoplasma sp.]